MKRLITYQFYGRFVCWLCLLGVPVGKNEIGDINNYTPIALLDDAVVYNYIDDDGTLVIGRYDFSSKKQSDTVSIEEFYISSGNPVVIGDSPKNCDTAEMYAYTANLKESGKGSFEDTVLKAAVAKALKNAEQRSSASWSFSEKTDWAKIVNDIMQSEYSYGDLKGYMEWKKFLGFLEK